MGAKFRWEQKHTQILVLVKQGKSTEEIAKIMGTYPKYIQRLKCRPEFIEKEQQVDNKTTGKVAEFLTEEITKNTLLKQSAFTELEKAAPKAAKIIVQVMSRAPTGDKTILAERRLQFEAAQDILSRVISKPKEVIETISRDYSPQEIESARQTMGEILKMVTSMDGRNPHEFLLGVVPETPIKPPEEVDEEDETTGQAPQQNSDEELIGG